MIYVHLLLLKIMTLLYSAAAADDDDRAYSFPGKFCQIPRTILQNSAAHSFNIVHIPRLTMVIYL